MRVRMNRTTGVALAVAVLAPLAAFSSADPVAGTTPKASGSANAGGSGGDGPDASPAAWPRPCTLVSGAEAATALGQKTPMTPKTDTEDACDYQGTNDVDQVAVNIHAAAYQPGTEDVVVNTLGKDTARKVDGLGDAAISFNLGFQTQYHVWAKGRYLLIVVSRMDGGDLDAQAHILATAAVSRLEPGQRQPEGRRAVEDPH